MTLWLLPLSLAAMTLRLLLLNLATMTLWLLWLNLTAMTLWLNLQSWLFGYGSCCSIFQPWLFWLPSQNSSHESSGSSGSILRQDSLDNNAPPCSHDSLFALVGSSCNNSDHVAQFCNHSYPLAQPYFAAIAHLAPVAQPCFFVTLLRKISWY